jgi:hypothetical protein
MIGVDSGSPYQDAEKLIHEFFIPTESGTSPNSVSTNQSLA